MKRFSSSALSFVRQIEDVLSSDGWIWWNRKMLSRVFGSKSSLCAMIWIIVGLNRVYVHRPFSMLFNRSTASFPGFDWQTREEDRRIYLQSAEWSSADETISASYNEVSWLTRRTLFDEECPLKTKKYEWVRSFISLCFYTIKYIRKISRALSWKINPSLWLSSIFANVSRSSIDALAIVWVRQSVRWHLFQDGQRRLVDL